MSSSPAGDVDSPSDEVLPSPPAHGFRADSDGGTDEAPDNDDEVFQPGFSGIPAAQNSYTFQRLHTSPPIFNRYQGSRATRARAAAVRILNAKEYAFWFNEAHFQFLRRLRAQHAWSFARSGNSVVLAMHVVYDDFRVWNRLYGTAGAVAVASLSKKSVWRLQAEVLASVVESMRRFVVSDLRRSGSADDDSAASGYKLSDDRKSDDQEPGNEKSKDETSENQGPSNQKAASEGPNSSADGRVVRILPPGPPRFSAAGLEFKKVVKSESDRIGTAGSLITVVSMAALALHYLSQTHWIARSCWISSMTTALLAVYFSNDQAWTISQLSSEEQLRAWIRDVDAADNYEVLLLLALRDGNEAASKIVMDSLAPSPSSAITISAPSSLLSSSLLLLLAGMGVFLGFTWTRELDVDAGALDSRNVFIVYVVVMAVSLAVVGFFSLVRTSIPARSTILKSLVQLQSWVSKEN